MIGFAKMVDMGKSPADVTKEIGSFAMPADVKSRPSVPVYPYGLCISLDEGSLKKLGLDGELPEVGESVHFCCAAKVTSVSQNEREMTNGSKTTECRVELQITALGMPAASESEQAEQVSAARRSKWYGEPDGDEAAAA